MYEDALDELRARITAQADAAGDKGWLDIAVPVVVHEGGILRVPRGAFEQWCVHLCRAEHLVQPWRTVSPVGVKQGADDPLHTDWMLGAGLDPQAMRSAEVNPHCEELSAAVWQARGKLERRVLGRDCSVLLAGPDIEGAVLKPTAPGKVDWKAAEGQPPVLVLRDASPEWLEDVLHALDQGGAVVVEKGGSMAHLITEVRSHDRGPIVRVTGARKLYPDDGVVRVSTEAGTVRLVEQPRIVDTRALSSSWPPEEPVTAPPALWTPPAQEGGFGLSLNRKGHRPQESMGYMEPIYRIDARDHTLHASMQWSGQHTWQGSRGNYPSMLVAHIVGRDGKSTLRATVTSTLRVWNYGDIGKACHQALYLAAPSEHPDSPQTQAARAHYAKQEHDWWLRSHEGHDDATLVEHARKELQDRTDMVAEGPSYLFEPRDDHEYWDALDSYRHTFRHYDIEFEARGMEQRIFDLEMAMPAVPVPPSSSTGPTP
jgi:hypothetical protein